MKRIDSFLLPRDESKNDVSAPGRFSPPFRPGDLKGVDMINEILIIIGVFTVIGIDIYVLILTATDWLNEEEKYKG